MFLCRMPLDIISRKNSSLEGTLSVPGFDPILFTFEDTYFLVFTPHIM
jgi:hypothetical protein